MVTLADLTARPRQQAHQPWSLTVGSGEMVRRLAEVAYGPITVRWTEVVGAASWQAASALAGLERRRRDAETTLARIAAGDREAIGPYLVEARRVWRQRAAAVYETAAPAGSVAATVVHQATWQAVDHGLAAEAARQGRSPQHVLTSLLTAELMALGAEGPDGETWPWE